MALSTAVSLCLCCAAVLPAQQLFSEALTRFPTDTHHVEYENLSTLRSLPNFAALQARFFAKPLSELEESFAIAGIAADDIDEIVTGSREPQPSAATAYGILSGRIRLNPKAVFKARIEQTVVYCLPTEKSGLCFISEDGVSTMFGSFSRLYSMLHAEQGVVAALNNDPKITDLLSATNTTDNIRGLADGTQLGESIRALLPSSLSGLADWSQLFSSVQTFIYGISIGRTATIHIEAACKTESAATSLQQMLAMFAGLQNDASPLSMIKNMKATHADSHVTLSFDTSLLQQ